MSAQENEIAAVQSLLSSGRRPSIFFTGEPGTGKTALFKNIAEMMERQDADDRANALKNAQVFLTGNVASNGAFPDLSQAAQEAFTKSLNAALPPALINRIQDIHIQPMSEAMQRTVTKKLVERQIRQKGIAEEDFADTHSFVVGKVTAAFNANEGLRGLNNAISQVFESSTFAQFVSHGTPSGRKHRGNAVAEVVSKGVVTNTEAPAPASFRRRMVTA